VGVVEEAAGYRILDQAGQGGFAVVYRAHQESIDRIVALKVLSVDKIDQRTMRQFQRELHLTGRLTGHPNVVTAFDTGITRSGRPYIAMEFCEGGSLRDRVRAEGPLPVADMLRVGVKLAGALAAVHEAGVLHGDIKPQNILITRYGEPAIADFGVARVVDSAEVSATSHSFTPLHAAPEILSGQQHTVPSDIYSLGSTLYHLLAGQAAFHNPADPSIGPLMLRVLSHAPPPITRPGVPRGVFEMIARAMAKRPEERYGSALEFAHAIQRLQEELHLSRTDLIGEGAGGAAGTASAGPGRERPASERSGFRRHLAAGMAVAALAGAGIGVAVFVAGRDSALPARELQASKPELQASKPTAAATGKGVDKAVLAVLAPRRLKVVSDQGSTVTLRWALPANARPYPLVLQQSPAGRDVIKPLESGTTSTRVFDLDPRRGYCFLIGVAVSIGEKSSAAWSKPSCIRGAVAG
jgi:serine/threonine-protein kinase PknK